MSELGSAAPDLDTATSTFVDTGFAGTAVIALAACGVVVADWPSTLSDLRAGMQAGQIDAVRVVGGLPAEARGFATVTLAWDEGARHRYATVVQVSDPAAMTEAGQPGTERVVGSVEDLLRSVDGSVAITRSDRGVADTGLGGWRFPGWFALALFLVWAAALVLLAQGPEPWWATRAAWAWGLLSPAALVVVPLFVLLSGPPPGVTSAGETGRRLRGGLAFVLVWLVGPPLVHQLLP